MADDVQNYEDDGADLVPREHIKQLEEQARKAKDLEAELETVRREAAFAKALGSSAEHPGAKYFIKAFDGPLDVESIKAAATEAGFIGQPEPAQPPPPDPSAYDRLAGASRGAGTPPPPSPIDDIAAAQNEEEVLAAVERAGGITTRMIQ